MNQAPSKIQALSGGNQGLNSIRVHYTQIYHCNRYYVFALGCFTLNSQADTPTEHYASKIEA